MRWCAARPIRRAFPDAERSLAELEPSAPPRSPYYRPTRLLVFRHPSVLALIARTISIGSPHQRMTHRIFDVQLVDGMGTPRKPTATKQCPGNVLRDHPSNLASLG